jgi:signal transduction histidine kinase
VKELAGEFNHMAARLADLVDAQARFVADASHQLRSPLTALRLRLENLEADVGQGTSDGIAAAGRELQRLSRVVDGLSTLGRAGQNEPRREPVDVEAVISDRCEAWAALADEKDVSLVKSGPHADSQLRSALVPGDLDQMLDNLLANALDAIPAGSTIRLSVEAGPAGRAQIHVADQGPGMTEGDRRRAFDPFWRGASSMGAIAGSVWRSCNSWPTATTRPFSWFLWTRRVWTR